MGEVEISSRISESGFGVKINFNTNGEIIKNEHISSNQGTTVKVNKLFQTIPVRFKQFKASIKKQIIKIVELLTNYAMFYHNIKITCINWKTKGKSEIIYTKKAFETWEKNIEHMVGKKEFEKLVYFRTNLLERDINNNINNINNIHISGYITKRITSGSQRGTQSNGEEHYFSVNSRPIQTPRHIIQTIRGIYKEFNKEGECKSILQLNLPPSSIDINITPDKREVIIVREKELALELRERILDFLGDSLNSGGLGGLGGVDVDVDVEHSSCGVGKRCRGDLVYIDNASLDNELGGKRMKVMGDERYERMDNIYIGSKSKIIKEEYKTDAQPTERDNQQSPKFPYINFQPEGNFPTPSNIDKGLLSESEIFPPENIFREGKGVTKIPSDSFSINTNINAMSKSRRILKPPKPRSFDHNMLTNNTKQREIDFQLMHKQFKEQIMGSEEKVLGVDLDTFANQLMEYPNNSDMRDRNNIIVNLSGDFEDIGKLEDIEDLAINLGNINLK